MKKSKLDKSKALKQLKKHTERLAKEAKTPADKEYADLQYTWNEDVLARSVDYLTGDTKKAMGIGTFFGALEMSLAPMFNEVWAVDHKSYLPKWAPDNIHFHQADIDTNEWRLPEDLGMFDVVYFIETIEHLLWSPLPLLKWMKTYSHISVISTPDDIEWPPMEIRPWTRYQHFSNIPSAAPGVKGNPEPMNHCKQYTQAEFIEILDFVGFRVIEFFRTGEGNHQMVAIVQPRNP